MDTLSFQEPPLDLGGAERPAAAELAKAVDDPVGRDILGAAVEGPTDLSRVARMPEQPSNRPVADDPATRHAADQGEHALVEARHAVGKLIRCRRGAFPPMVDAR